jgi:rubrerythrin
LESKLNLENFQQILDFAIEKEEEAYSFYNDLAKVTSKPEMRTVFLDFAQEEMGHKKKLLSLRTGKTVNAVSPNIPDLKIADYTVDIVPKSDMDYQEALILAMKKEKSAFKLYSDLAKIVLEDNLKSLFLMLAQEEAKHKLRFELEYDREILKEN